MVAFEAGSPQMRDAILRELARSRGNTVIHAGHYALVTSDREAQDYLLVPILAPQGLRSWISFAHLTWETACCCISDIPYYQNPKLLVLVNDWLYLKSMLSTKQDQEREKVEMRRRYYESVPKLPRYYMGVAEASGITSDQVFKASDSCWLFSEAELRQRFVQRLQLLVEADPGLERIVEQSGPRICTVVDNQSVELSRCGTTNCLGEFIELLKQLYDRGVRSFINIYPTDCREFVDQGTNVARELFGLKGMEIVNIPTIIQ